MSNQKMFVKGAGTPDAPACVATVSCDIHPCGDEGRYCALCPARDGNDAPAAVFTMPSQNYWQLCPKCLGAGIVPSASTTLHRACDVCCGKMIISTITGMPPAFG